MVVALPGGGVATGAVGGAIEIWERQSNRLERAGTLSGHDSDVRALAVLPDGSLASGGEDDSIRLWKHARRLPHGDFVTSLRVLADGTLASASYDGTIRLWA